ncbi:MAG: hypothetical protein MUQ32_08435 [Chloroflexi bacterium]|nr:hypothetical protein [Chloroflexota bacterium]
MDWLDALLVNMGSVFIVMSLLAIIIPSLRRSGSWRGIGAAWLVTVAVTLLVAFTHLDDWALDCNLGVLRSGVTGGTLLNPGEPCTGANSLPPWLVALPPLIGIAILLAWVWRHTPPLPATLRTVGALIATAVVIVGLGQVNANAALLAVVVVAVAVFAWPRLRRQRAA